MSEQSCKAKPPQAYLPPSFGSSIRRNVPDLQRPCPQHPRPLILGHVRRRAPVLLGHFFLLVPQHPSLPTRSARLAGVAAAGIYFHHASTTTASAIGGGLLRVWIVCGRGGRLSVGCQSRGRVGIVWGEGRFVVIEGGFLGLVIVAIRFQELVSHFFMEGGGLVQGFLAEQSKAQREQPE